MLLAKPNAKNCTYYKSVKIDLKIEFFLKKLKQKNFKINNLIYKNSDLVK